MLCWGVTRDAGWDHGPPDLLPPALLHTDPILISLKEGYKKTSRIVFKAPVKAKRSVLVNGIDLLENVPPRTENEVGQRGMGMGTAANGR